MSDEEKKLTFKTEDERQRALEELPDEPGGAVANVDEWYADITRRRTEIESAEIVGGGTDDSSKAAGGDPPPESQLDPTARSEKKDPPEMSPDELVTFGDVKRGDLPETLQHYKSGAEILKQAAHARDYANNVELRLKETLQKYEDSTARITELQQDIATLKKERETAQSKVDSPETTTRQKSQASDKIDRLNAEIARISSLADDEAVSAKDVRESFVTAGEAMSEMGTVLSETRKQLEEAQAANGKIIAEFRTELETVSKTQKQSVADQQRREANTALEKDIQGLQSTYPELKTSKPVMDYGDALSASVEKDVRDFTDKVLLAKEGRMAGNDWSVRNQILSAYLRGDAEMRQFCAERGITPEATGSTENDFKAYAMIVNTHALATGYEIDPYSGQRQPLRNPYTGQHTSIPDLSSAYEHVLKKSGVRQAELNRIREEAEKRGQQSLERSLQKRDDAAKVLGDEHGSSPEHAGTDMTEAEALQILNASNEFEIEQAGMMGDYGPFNRFLKAYKRLKLSEQGVPEPQPNPDWPAPVSA